jgi:hypothetical protein
MSDEEQFPLPGLLDIYDELTAAQHFLGLANVYRDAGQEAEAAEYGAVSTRHWQRAGWIAEALLTSAPTAVDSPSSGPATETQSGSALQNDPPSETPVQNAAAPIQPEPEVWPILRARHLAGTINELSPIGGSLEELPIALTPCFPSDSLKPEKVH